MAKKTNGHTATAELVPTTPDQEEREFTKQAGSAIATFMAGLGKFFQRAKELETDAKAKLEKAKGLKPATNADEDAALQAFIKSSNADKKELVEHWSISSTIYNLHRRVTARRNYGAEMLEQSADIAQKLHNKYVEDERKRAQIEQDRIRREAEAKAEQDRQRDLAELERQACEAEASSPDLSARESAFVKAYFEGRTEGNAVESARAAGYKDPAMMGARLIDTPKIQTALQATATALALRMQKAGVAEAPLDVQVEEVKPDIRRAAGAVDRTRWHAEVDDAAKFIDAVFAGTFNIPRDVLKIDEVKLNQYATAMHADLNRWPGVRGVSDTRTV